MPEAPVVERPAVAAKPAAASTSTSTSPSSATATPAPRSAPSSAPPSFAALAPTAYADDSFEVPSLRRSRTPLVLGLLVLALVLGGGGAYLYMNRGDDTKPDHVAQASADAAESGAASTGEVDAAVIAAVTIDAAEAPEIEIEPEPVATEPPPAAESRKKPRRDGKPKVAPDTEPDNPTPDEPDPAKTTPDEPPPKRAVPGCEEVECVMEGYKRACCARFKPADDGFKPTTVPAENLQKTQIKAGIAKVRAKVMACGEQFPTKGTVKLAITVDPEGQITELDVVETPEDALGSCVAAAVRTATFAKTEGGGSFRQPFVF
ncbi:MAG TPA: hypothetical protein VIU61_21515 [Kofleriaceae bacterium]